MSVWSAISEQSFLHKLATVHTTHQPPYKYERHCDELQGGIESPFLSDKRRWLPGVHRDSLWDLVYWSVCCFVLFLSTIPDFHLLLVYLMEVCVWQTVDSLDFWRQQLGYVLGLILASTIDAQSKTPHPDVIHVTAHFLQSVDVSDYEVQVRRVRQGKKMSNLDAVLLQRVCIGSS